MMTDEYKLTINANICFDYHPYEKTASEEVPYIVNHNEIEYYDEEHEIELMITPIFAWYVTIYKDAYEMVSDVKGFRVNNSVEELQEMFDLLKEVLL